jgi:hypothetical protein
MGPLMENLLKKRLIVFQIMFLLVINVSISGCIDFGDDNDKSKNGSDNKFLTLSELETQVEDINENALAWVDSLDVDPIKLREERDMKGKKNYVQVLDIYHSLFSTTADPQKKEEYKNKTQELAQITHNWKYHDLNEINDTQFRQDSTSYLRAWYLINEFGFDTEYYITEIERVLPRLNSHLPSRGTNQKMAFVFYYGQLGYPINYTLAELFNNSEIRRKTGADELEEIDVYFITHEIFFLHDDNQMDLLTTDDIAYLNETIKFWVNKTIAEANVDLLAELVMIMTQLEFVSISEYDTALRTILSSQNKNGSFGYYEDAREYYQKIGSKIDVDIYLYLHTTEVVLRALNEALYYKSMNN